MIRVGRLPSGADQFNSVHERLLDALPLIVGNGNCIYFTAVTSNEEDSGCIKYLADCAVQAGLDARLIDIAQIGIDAEGWFTDTADMRIETLFKLYPLEDMVREEFGIHLQSTGTRIIEPIWKLLLSTKALLPVLWEMFPNHPNLLEAYFEDDPRVARLGSSYVRKPFLSREGANVTIMSPEQNVGRIEVEGYIRQQLQLLPQFGADWTVVGSWVIAGQPAGIGLREDATPITRDTSRFVPHFILD
jgi:glutathionylspermidine synthase